MSLVKEYEPGINIIFANDEVVCPICEQSNTVYLRRVADKRKFCVECYKAYKIGYEDGFKQYLSELYHV